MSWLDPDVRVFVWQDGTEGRLYFIRKRQVPRWLYCLLMRRWDN